MRKFAVCKKCRIIIGCMPSDQGEKINPCARCCILSKNCNPVNIVKKGEGKFVECICDGCKK